MTLPTDNNLRAPAGWLRAALFIAAVLAVGLLIGYATQPGPWYASLAKPSFNPPSWVFGPVWTILYILIAIAGWRIWNLAPRSGAMVAWGGQMILNWLWSPAFFAAHSLWLALAIILAMLASIVAFIVLAWRVDRLAAALFIPYAVWVAFATLLNGSIAVLNP